MKKNLPVLIGLLVLASIVFAGCSPVQTQQSPTGFLGEATGPQITGIQPLEGYYLAAMVNNDYKLSSGNIMATLVVFGESTPPAEFVIDITIGEEDYKTRAAPNSSFEIPQANIDAYMNPTKISAEGWKCDKRTGTNIWDCKPK